MLSLTDEQRLLVSSLRDLAEREFTERACRWEGARPWENLELLADRGFLGLSLPEEYGGGGMSPLDAVLMVETVGRICPDTAYSLPDLVAPRTVEMFGSEAVKERYLPSVIAGEDFIPIAISEPEAGSDVGAMTTTVTEGDDGELFLNGQKTWVSGVPDANAAVVWVRFPEGLGTVVVDLDSSGVEIAQHFENMFGHTQSQFFLEDVHVPQENVLVRGEEAFRELLRSLNWERLGSAVLSNAAALCAFDRALEYAGERRQFGQPIGDFQGVEWKLAGMATRLQATRSLVYSAAVEAHESGQPPGRMVASMANLYSARTLEYVASEALQIHGANGYQQGHPIEYLYRFARGRRIAAGTDEIQLNTIAGALKREGLPWIE